MTRSDAERVHDILDACNKMVEIKEADEHGVTMQGAFALCALRGWEIESLVGFSDAYSLDAAGFYLARQGQFIEWPLVELARDCSGGAVESWPTARDEFRRMAMALQSS